MDIRIHGPEADAAERDAVNSVLGDRERPPRDLLLPALHAVQDRFGWLQPGALNYICRRMDLPPAEVFGIATFYHLFSISPAPIEVVHVCDDIACRIKGAEAVCADLEKKGVAWKRSPCLGQCERAPATLTLGGDGGELGRQGVRPLVSPKDGRLLRRIGKVNPGSVEEYQREGGYAGLKKAFELGREAVIREVTASNLVGRGGAAFPTGRKWDAVAKAPAHPHHVVCNADESEPGTFKDRVLMEGDPFSIIEGVTIAGYATSSERGFFYIRGEYPLAIERVQSAILAARASGFLGENILGSGYSFDIEVRRGAGAYICGEETALFNSIEGKRGEPRNKPPFPVNVGLFGKPTVINNVETLANVPLVMTESGKTFAGIGTGSSTGPKLFCVSGHIASPGLYEVPFGRTLRELIEMAGGVPDTKKIQTILLGGAAGMFIGPDKLDVPLTFEGTRAIGATLGSGVVMVFDETVDMWDILARIAEFFRDESCGQCVPCRVGTVRQKELLARLRSGRTIGSTQDELALLNEIGQAMRDASICGLGQTATNAIESALANLKL